MKDNDLEHLLKALANRRRLAIVKILKEKKKATVGNIAGQIELSFRATSKHLQILYVADIVDREQSGLSVLYKLNSPHSLIKSILINL